MLQCDSPILQCDSLAANESGVILSMPSRFGRQRWEWTLDILAMNGLERLRVAGGASCRAAGGLSAQSRDDRAEQVKFRRFLLNDSVTVDEMVSHRASLVAKAARGRHVLAIQDTSEINYQAQRGRKRRLGTVGNGTDVGLFVHPVLAIDADSEECLGLVDAQVWRRRKRKAANYKCLPIERKESYRWVKGGAQAKSVLTQASMVTIMDDRRAISMKNGYVCRTDARIF